MGSSSCSTVIVDLGEASNATSRTIISIEAGITVAAATDNTNHHHNNNNNKFVGEETIVAWIWREKERQ